LTNADIGAILEVVRALLNHVHERRRITRELTQQGSIRAKQIRRLRVELSAPMRRAFAKSHGDSEILARLKRKGAQATELRLASTSQDILTASGIAHQPTAHKSMGKARSEIVENESKVSAIQQEEKRGMGLIHGLELIQAPLADFIKSQPSSIPETDKSSPWKFSKQDESPSTRGGFAKELKAKAQPQILETTADEELSKVKEELAQLRRDIKSLQDVKENLIYEITELQVHVTMQVDKPIRKQRGKTEDRQDLVHHSRYVPGPPRSNLSRCISVLLMGFVGVIGFIIFCCAKS
jgi:hypothetical protein